MAFADEIEKQSTSKYRLVRFELSFDGTPNLASAGGGLYTLTSTALSNVFKVQRNGSNLTEVTGVPSTNDRWSFDEDSGLFQVKLASAPNSSSNVIIIFSYVFFSSGKTLHNEDPENTSTTLRDWEPRLEPFQIDNSVNNILNGVITAASSSIMIANHDKSLNKFFANDFSFYNRDLKIWQVVGGNVQKLFFGISKDIDIQQDFIRFSIEDAFSKFDEPALMGDTIQNSTYNTTEFPNVHPDFRGKPIPYVFTKMPGDVGFSDSLKRHSVSSSTIGSGTSVPQNLPENIFRCVPINISSREFVVCRSGANGRKSNSFGTISSISVTAPSSSQMYLYNSGITSLPDADNSLSFGETGTTNNLLVSDTGNYSERTEIVISTNSHNMNIGESFKISNIDPNASLNNHLVDGHFVITKTTSTTIHAMCTNLMPNLFDFGSITTLNSANLSSSSYPAIFVVQSGKIYFMDQLDITSFTQQTLPSGNKLIKFTLDEFAFNDVITTNGGTGELVDPASIQKHQGSGRITIDDGVYCRFITDDSVEDDEHQEVVQKFFDSIGVPVNASSISQAETDLDAKAIFTVPFVSESTFSPYRFYLEKLLKSVLGAIYIDNNFEANYVLFNSAPSAGDTRDSTDASGINIDLNYRDIVNRAVFRNVNDSRTSGITSFTAITDPGSSTTKNDNTAKYLYNISKEIVIEHLLNNTNRTDEIFNFLSRRQNTYTFVTAHKDLLSLINDDITINDVNLLGVSSQNVKIIGIRKSDNNVVLTLTDLEGLS